MRGRDGGWVGGGGGLVFEISSTDVLSLLAPNWVAVLIHPHQSQPQSRTQETRQDTERRGGHEMVKGR